MAPIPDRNHGRRWLCPSFSFHIATGPRKRRSPPSMRFASSQARCLFRLIGNSAAALTAYMGFQDALSKTFDVRTRDGSLVSPEACEHETGNRCAAW